MQERLTTREIVDRTNQVFYGRFGKIVAPALIAGLFDYWAAVGLSRIGHWIDYGLVHYFKGDSAAAIRAVIIPGILLRLAGYAANTLFWGGAFALIAQIVMVSESRESDQRPSGVRLLLLEPGWLPLLWRLYWRLAIPGYLALTASSASAVWVTHLFRLNLALPRDQFCLEVLVLVFFGLVYMWYARRYTLAIPLPIVAGDTPIDPLSASAAASLRWRVPIITSTLMVLFISNLCDYHLPRLLLMTATVRRDVFASYLIWMLVSLATSILWAWLFVFLTEIAMVDSSAEMVVADAGSAPAVIPNS